MPMKWVPPEVFLERKGIKIYHVYKDDDYEIPRLYWYGTSTLASDGETQHSFDVRGLPTWKPTGRCEEKAIREAIEKAIDLGLLESTEEDGGPGGDA